MTTHDYDVWLIYRRRISDVTTEELAETLAREEVNAAVAPDSVEVEEVNEP